MPQVLQPGSVQNKDRQIFQLGGALIGGVTTMTPQGAMAGAGAGATAADIGSGPQAQSVQAPSPGTGALARRQQQLETDNLTTLRNAEMAAARLPEQQRQRILPTLTQARMLEQRQRGVT